MKDDDAAGAQVANEFSQGCHRISRMLEHIPTDDSVKWVCECYFSEIPFPE